MALGLAGLLAVWLLLIIQPPPARAAGPTFVSGTINTNTTWTLANSPYIVQGTLIVAPGITLTVEPGVLVQTNPAAIWIDVRGTLFAEGTLAQPITFTSAATNPTPGDWYGIHINQNGGTVRLAYCDVSYAGQNSTMGAVRLPNSNAGRLTMRNCRIHHNNGIGVYLGGVNTRPTLENVELDHNSTQPIYVLSLDAAPTFTNLNLHDNGRNGVYVADGALNSADVTLDGSPAALNGSPIIFGGGFAINAGRVLTITPGSLIQTDVAANNVWNVLGKLIAEGTPTQPITFTSGAATPAPGDWGGFAVDGSGREARLAHCRVAYAGGSGGGGQAIRNISGGLLSARHCRIDHSAGNGFRLSNNVQPLLENIEIDHNAGHAVFVDNFNIAPTLRHLNAHDNGANAVVINGGTLNSGGTATYSQVGVPLLVNGPIGVAFPYSLILGAGVEMRFAAATDLSVFGSLYALGTPQQPVTFTAQSGAPGGWFGIDIESTGLARMVNCTISNAGASGPMLELLSSNVQAQNCLITGSAADGVRANVASGMPQINYSQIYGNAFGVRSSGAATVDARHNWWGHASGPFHANLNPGGSGSQVSDRVLFDPWLGQPGGLPLLVTPNRGGDTGQVTVTAYGLAFNSSASLKLTRSGQADIVGLVRGIGADGGLQVTLNLNGAAQGDWNVVVNNGSGVSVTFPNGFTVEPGQTPLVWFDTLGRNSMLVNRNNRYFLLYGNRSNVDVAGLHLRFKAPTDFQFVQFPVQTARLTNLPDANANVLVFVAPILPAGSQGALELRLKPTQEGDYDFELSAQSPVMPDGPDIFRVDPSTTVGVQSLQSNGNTHVMKIDVAGPQVNGIGTLTLVVENSSVEIEPVVNITENGNNIHIEYDMTAPAGAVLSLAGQEIGPASTLTRIKGAYDSTKEVKGHLDTLAGAYHDSQEAGQKMVENANMIDCLADINVLGPGDLETLNNLNEGSGITAGAKILKDGLPGGGGTAGPVIDLFDGIMGSAVKTKVWNMARTGQLLDVGIGPGSADDVMQQVMDICNDKEKRKMAARASHDPNDKVGAEGAGPQHYITGLEPLRYAIFFENVATATAPAQEVFITDTLDAGTLDLSTFRLHQITFGERVVNVPGGRVPFSDEVDLRPDKNLIVRINVLLNPTTGLLTAYFGSIDPDTGLLTEDPLGGFLPPNSNGSGEGSLVFTVKPKPSLSTGAQIRNKATIVFDLNTPIETPQWLNTIDNSLPDSLVATLPISQTSACFPVSWSGSDSGAGIQDYTLYVSRDGGTYKRWLPHTTATSGQYCAAQSGVYAFYSIAHDGANNIEVAPASPDATTQAPGGASPAGGQIYLPIVLK
jgi:hypothetical protein